MTPNDVKAHYRTGYNFKKVTGMSDNNLTNWFKYGYIPFKSQKKLEEMTGGALKAEWDNSEPYFSKIKQPTK